MLKKLFYIPLFLYFLPAFIIPCFQKAQVPFLTIFIPIFLGLIFFISPKKYLLHFFYLYKKSPFKYFCWFYLAIFITSLCAVILGRYSLFKMLYTLFYSILFNVVLLYLYPAFLLPRFFALKRIIRFLFFMYFIIFLWGFLEFLGATLHISIINNLILFFSNIRSEDGNIIIEAHSGLARIRSFFMEPSSYAQFLTVNLPILFGFITYKGKIVKNILIDKLLKITLLIFLLISVVLIQSPIFLVFMSIVAFLLIFQKIQKFIIKHIKLFLLFLFIMIICSIIFFIIFINSNLERTFIVRILNVFITILLNPSLEDLIIIEPSLAARVIFYTIEFNIWQHYPIVGIGIGNNGPMYLSYFLNTNLPMTAETLMSIQSAERSFNAQATLGLYLLDFSGIIGFSFYVLFMQKIISGLKKSIKYFHGIEKNFVDTLSKSIMVAFVLSIFYNLNIFDQNFWLLCGIATAVVYIVKKRINIKL